MNHVLRYRQNIAIEDSPSPITKSFRRAAAAVWFQVKAGPLGLLLMRLGEGIGKGEVDGEYLSARVESEVAIVAKGLSLPPGVAMDQLLLRLLSPAERNNPTLLFAVYEDIEQFGEA
ncbi:hypothetical protein Droror1_Dr00028248, partial [Drosera rotundifolia]